MKPLHARITAMLSSPSGRRVAVLAHAQQNTRSAAVVTMDMPWTARKTATLVTVGIRQW